MGRKKTTFLIRKCEISVSVSLKVMLSQVVLLQEILVRMNWYSKCKSHNVIHLCIIFIIGYSYIGLYTVELNICIHEYICI